MRKLAILGSVLVALTASPAPAATTSPIIAGDVAASENSCAWISMALALSDCSYGNHMVSGFSGQAQWIGPTFGGAYYVPGSVHAVVTYNPVAGDDRIQPALSGDLTIDDQGTPAGTDDTIGGTIVFGTAARSIATGAAGRVIESWTSVTHTLLPTVVNFATANAAGGFDYIIGDKGDPGRLCASANPDDCFPSENAPGTVDTTTIWPLPAADALSIERISNLAGEGVGGGPYQNRGATTTAVIADYACVTRIPGDCDTSTIVWGNTTGTQAPPPGDPRETPGFDNLILLISTNADGDITAAEAYWTQTYLISLGNVNSGDNSAAMGYFTFTGGAPGAKADAAEAETGVAAVIDVLGNDIGFVDPVTVTVTVAPDQAGSAVVNGSPGAAGGVDITYTSAPAFTGTETFTYQVDDGVLVSTAVVTVTVTDTVPDAFSFATQTDVAFSSPITSAAATISGISTGVPVTVAGGEYSIGCTATYTAAAGTITNTQDVCVRHTSAATGVTNTVTTLTVGGVDGTFTTTTQATDTTPAGFAFTDETDAALNTPITSDPVTITGINSPAAVTVTGGDYSVGCTASFVSTPGTIANNQTVCVRQTSSSVPDTDTDAILTVGGVSDTFTVTTVAIVPDTNPEPFTFVDQDGVDQSATIVSAPVTITGINSPAAVTVTGGEYSIGCTATFTAAAGAISNGQTVCVRHTSSASVGTAVTTTLTVGTAPNARSDAFSSATRRPGGSSSADGLMLGFLGLLALLRRGRRAPVLTD